ncbi:MAG: methyltransferase domain-containing protein [Coriobacteriia bacterium]
MTPKVVILDFDGTLVDSVGIKDRAFASLYAHLPEWPEIERYHLANNAVIRFEKFRHIAEDILGEPYTPETEERLAAEFSACVTEAIVACPWVDGALEFLREWSARVPLYLVSVNPAGELARILEAREAAGFFREVYATPWVKTDAFADILAREGVSAADAVFVGDTPEDRAFAEKAGIPFVGRDSGKPLGEGVPVFADMRGVSAFLDSGGAPASCPACGEPWRESGPRLPYPASGSEDAPGLPSEVAVCAECGTGVAVPPISDEQTAALYGEGGYWKPVDVVDLRPHLHPGHVALARARWAFVEPFLAANGRDGARVLDVGAGHGFLGVAAAQGASVRCVEYWAAEPDSAMLSSLEAAWPRLASACALRGCADAADAEGAFDLVVLSNVLEHVAQPLALLTLVASKLGEDGLVLIDVPNGDHRFKADVFPHLVFFSREGLSRLLARAGLEVLACEGFGRAYVKSPINGARRTLKVRAVERLYGLRRLLPARVSAAFFDSYFGASRRDADGTWLRAVGGKHQVVDNEGSDRDGT